MNYLLDHAKSLGKIILAMFVTTAILLFVLALFVWQLQPGGRVISIGISVVYVVSCLVGGFFAGKVQGTKKFVWGMLMGFLYVIVLLGITLIVMKGFHADLSQFVLNLLLCLGGGMIGGMIS